MCVSTAGSLGCTADSCPSSTCRQLPEVLSVSPASHLVVADFPGNGRKREGSNFWLLIGDCEITLPRCVGAKMGMLWLSSAYSMPLFPGVYAVALSLTGTLSSSSIGPGKNMVSKLKITEWWVVESGPTHGL